MSSKSPSWHRRRVPLPIFLILIALFTILGLSTMDLRSIDSSSKLSIKNRTLEISGKEAISANTTSNELLEPNVGKTCATVEEMGEIFSRGYTEESLRVRRIIHNHFAVNGASRVRELHPDKFCNHGFVIGKASEAGLGNELYKLLTAAALSVMLNRSLIIGQTRHIEVDILLVIISPIPTFPSR
ncbi:hypothetical protein PHJA_002880600 [Phtheirospermum japonicum]|uniref:Uncharacterized protein n=1 Tax=Phtheirospermum japonicum TaxID=374723 RepID=A0A830DGB5_9LAMI|nr:hypothetical protein PHJA_002880600 [Phtheirospermum japonicum]